MVKLLPSSSVTVTGKTSGLELGLGDGLLVAELVGVADGLGEGLEFVAPWKYSKLPAEATKRTAITAIAIRYVFFAIYPLSLMLDGLSIQHVNIKVSTKPKKPASQQLNKDSESANASVRGRFKKSIHICEVT